MLDNLKNISFVYTQKNKDSFVANGYDLMPKDYFRPVTFFDCGEWYERYLRSKCNVCFKSIDELTDDHLHIYAISHPNLMYHSFKDLNITLPKKIIESTNTNKNFYVLLLNAHECDNEEGFSSICTKFENDGVDLSKLILMNNNSKLYDYKKNIKSDVIVHKSFLLNDLFISKFQKDINTPYITKKRGKFFMTRNRMNKPHRKNLIFDIIKRNLEKDVNYSFINVNGESDYLNFSPFEGFQSKNDIMNNKDLLISINKMFKECDYELHKKYINSNTKEYIYEDSSPEVFLIPEYPLAFHNSYFNIITETCFQESNRIHITEKTFRPFYYYQFPIFLATEGHVNQLKKDYNFDMFDDIIDHSYDNESDYVKRYHMVINEIVRINNNKDFYIDFYKNNKSRFMNNRKKLYEYSNILRNKDIDFFYNLCD